jgi:hypothetical protein
VPGAHGPTKLAAIGRRVGILRLRARGRINGRGCTSLPSGTWDCSRSFNRWLPTFRGLWRLIAFPWRISAAEHAIGRPLATVEEIRFGSTISSPWIPAPIKELIAERRPPPDEVGYFVADQAFASSHFGDHPLLTGATLRIPFEWDDPSVPLRWEAKAILDSFVRPRPYILQRARVFFARHMAGHYLIGVHARGTDATSPHELRPFRQGSLVLTRYCGEIERVLAFHPHAKLFVASDEQSSLRHLAAAFPGRVIAYDSIRHESGEAAGRGPTGWIMPAYIAGDRSVAARNGEDAIVEYLLLSQCDYLVHNGSSLARTVLLNAPELPHVNTHRRPPEEEAARNPRRDRRASTEGDL